MKLVIDAVSTSSGGAISHLKNLINYFNSQKYFSKLVIIIPKATQKKMPTFKNVKYQTLRFFEKNLILRTFWKGFLLKKTKEKYKMLIKKIKRFLERVNIAI